MQKVSSILVIGGGISGITASLDLADQGYNVILVEKSPSIGGRMAQLDKTFPTLDCSICILAPKMVSVSRHPNIDLYVYSEVIKVEKNNNKVGFKVDIKKKATYVDPSKCTGCGICMEKCGSKNIPSEFEEGLGTRKAIYIPFPQAVPRKAVIDSSNCLFLSEKSKNRCRICEKKCPNGAINYEMKDELITAEVASIIVATGFDIIDPTLKPALQRYNFDKFENVITAMQFERMMSASGPTLGHIIRPSDKVEPKNIAFILCVGSRSLDVCNYCSRFCCVYSTKEAVVTKEHAPNIDITIFYNDLRVIGKNQEEFLVRAEEEYGIKYIRGIPAEIKEDPITKKLIVRHADLISGNVYSKEFDLVVLSVAVIPKPDSHELGRLLGIFTDDYGWFESKNSLETVDTNVEGIFIAGCCHSPDDIANCVAKSSSAASRASNFARPMSTQELLKRKPKYKEKNVSITEEPRTGVFICDCGSNIAGFVDVPKLVEELKTNPHVTFVMENKYTCSQDSQDIIKQKIAEHNLNRVIVAACTPRTHESLFQETLQEAGINPYLFNFVSIRELVSWVHMKDREGANAKALDLIRMGISRVQKQQSLYPIIKPAIQKVAIIGGGIAGMSAALEIANHGFNVDIIERDEKIGGQLNVVGLFNFENLSGDDISKRYQDLINKNKLINVLYGSAVKQINGSIGNYNISVINNKNEKTEINSGAIIVATGAEEYKPTEKYYNYGKDPRVFTQLDLSNELKKGTLRDGEVIVFIQCVGSRQKENKSYCSLICCTETLRHVLHINEKYPNTRIYIMYRDIRVTFKDEINYWKARERNNYIRFIEYPTTEFQQEGIFINVKDMLSQAQLKIRADKLILATPLIPHKENKELSEILKVPLDSKGFFLEAHPKLRPVDFATDGIYLAGTAHGPKGFAESIFQGQAAASRALITVLKGFVQSEPIIAHVKPELCIGCQECEKVCPFGAIGVDVSKEKLVSSVNPLLCKGCGTCAAICPAQAIVVNNFTSEEINSMIEESMVVKNIKPKIVAFLCNWCSYAGADTCGVSRFQYPTNVRPIRVMCSGRVDPNYVLEAFLSGADGVIIGGCHLGDCHYLEGNYKALDRYKKLLKDIKQVGIDPRRLKLEWISASEGKRFAEVMTGFIEEIKSLNNNSEVKK